LASVVCWALLLIASSATNAQTTDPATGLPLSSTSNVLNLGGGLPWSNTVQGSAGGYSGGWTPAYNPSTGNIIFGYSTQTVSQTAAINTALANAGTGIQLAGYSYSWGINNEKSISGGNRGTVTGNVSLIGSSGNTLESFNYDYSSVNTASSVFQQFSGTQLFNNRYDTTAATGLQVSFTGKDQNYWAGYYGPRVHVNSVDLLYTTNPCATNPAYSPTCAGFKDVVTSSNLLPNPDAVATNGSTVYNTFAVNTALENSGAGVKVYGFNYSYNYSLGNGTYGCTATNQDGSCSWYMTTNPNAQVRVLLTNSSNQTVYTAGQSYSTPNTAENVSNKFLLSSTTNSLALGNFTMGAMVSGNAAVQNMSVTALYTPDPCVANPLSSTSCPGYGAAFAKQMLASLAAAPAASSTATTAAATSTATTSDSTATAAATTPVAVATAAPTPAPVAATTDTSGQQSSQQQQQQAAASAGSAPTATPVTSAAPSATNPQPQPGAVQMAGSTKPAETKSGPSALAMSVVAKEQAKVNATTAAVVSQANDAANSASSAALTTALTVAGSAQSASITAATATASSSSSSTNKTASSSSTSVITLQSNTPTTLSSLNNQRTASGQTAVTVVAETTTSFESTLPVKNDSAASTQTAVTTVQQTASQVLPTAPKQQEVVASSAEQTQTASLPPQAPRQQEAVQTAVQQVQMASTLPQAPKQQDTVQTATEQTQMASTLPVAPRLQEVVQTFAQQEQTGSLPPQAPKQQETAQAQVQQTSTAAVLPTAPRQQNQNTQSTGQQTQTASLPPQAPKQQEVVQAVVQQTATSTAAPTAPKQTQMETQTQATVVAMLQQQTQQAAPAQLPVVQYMPPPQPENRETSAFVDYSIFTQTNLDSMKKTTVATFTEVEVPRVETVKASGRGTINDYINPQAFMALQGAEQTQDGMVKRNVEPNEVAGAVDIANIATQPKGFDAYTKLTLLDAQFYKSEEVYKNQKTVDNERVLRGLLRGSDRLHQEMVDLQYKQGDSK